MNTEEKIIMYDSPEAATFLTNIEGWIDKDRRFWGKGKDGEHMARYSSCTHRVCECGQPMEKAYTKCESCIAKGRSERYLKMPFEEWDLKKPVVEWDGDRYFFDIDDLNDYMFDNEMEEIDLLICEPIHYSPIDGETVASDCHEDFEIPEKLQKKINEFNKFLATLPPHSWTDGKVRTSYRLPKSEQNDERSVATSAK